MTPDEQIELLRGVALRGVAEFGLVADEITLLVHEYNTTFRVVSDGVPHAVRVNTNSKSTPAHIRGQQAWVHAIATETDVLVADPVPAVNGEYFATITSEPGGRDFDVVVNGWLAGDDIEDFGEAPAEAVIAAGRTMAVLHDHAATWTIPDGVTFPSFTDPLMGDRDRLGEVDMPTADRDVLDETRRRGRAAFEALASHPVHPIHADLHASNLKWHEGRLAVFDFDDCGIGTRELDLAISLFYLRDGSAAQEAFLSGYRSVRPLPATDPQIIEALIAARQSLLTNLMFDVTNPEWLAEADDYLRTSLTRLTHWLDTGTFTRKP